MDYKKSVIRIIRTKSVIRMYKEKEVRIQIPDIKLFRKKLQELGAVLVHRYSCIDYVCEPKKKRWDPHFINLKIRRQISGDRRGIIELSFHKVRWEKKVKITTLGFKAKLEIPPSDIKIFIELMDWEKIFTYSRHGEHYRIKGHDFTLEKVNHLGHLVEIETTNLKELNKTVDLLRERKNIIKKSVPEMMYDKNEK